MKVSQQNFGAGLIGVTIAALIVYSCGARATDLERNLALAKVDRDAALKQCAAKPAAEQAKCKREVQALYDAAVKGQREAAQRKGGSK